MLNKKQISALKTVISKNNKRPVLQNIKLSANKIEITNLEYSLQLFGDYPIYCEADFLMPQDRFFKLADSLDYIQYEDKKAIVGKGKTTFKFPAYTTCDYPDTPANEDIDDLKAVITCDFEEIAIPFIDAAAFANKESSRYNINSVKLDFTNGLMIGTDQVQLRAVKCIKSDVKSFALPSALAPMLKTLTDVYGRDQITVQRGKDTVVIENSNFRITSRQIEAIFPNYVSAIASNSQSKGQIIGLKAIETGLKDIDLVLCENAMMGKLESNLDNLTISAFTPLGEVSHIIDCNQDYSFSDESYCGFSPAMVRNYLRTIKLYKLSVCEIVVQSPKKPVIIRDDKGFLFMSPVAL